MEINCEEEEKKLEEMLTEIQKFPSQQKILLDDFKFYLELLIEDTVKLHKIGKFDDSIELNLLLLRFAQATSDNIIEASILYAIGENYRSKGDLEKCEEYTKKSLEIAQKNSILEIVERCYNNLGLLRLSKAEYDESLKFLTKALEISAEIINPYEAQIHLRNIGRVYLYMNEYVKAMEYFQESLSLSEFIGDNSGITGNLNEIAVLYAKEGQYEEAEEFLNQILDNTENSHKTTISACLNNLGIIHQNKGFTQKALDCHQEALKISEEIGDELNIAVALSNISIVYSHLGFDEKAIESLEKSLEKVKERGFDYVLVRPLDSLATLYMNLSSKHRYEKKKSELYKKKAKNYLDQALVISLKYNNRLAEASCYHNFAIYEPKGRESLKLINKALSIFRSLNDKKRIIDSLLTKAIIYRLEGKITKAFDIAQDAYQKSLEIKSRLLEIQALTVFGQIHFSEKNYSEALEYYKKAIDLKEKEIIEIDTEYYRLSLRQSSLEIYYRAIESLIRIYNSHKKKDNNILFEIVKYVELIKAREITNKLNLKENVDLKQIWPEYMNLLTKEEEFYKEIVALRSEFNRQLIDKNDKTPVRFSVLKTKHDELVNLRSEIQAKCSDITFIHHSTEYNPVEKIKSILDNSPNTIIWYFFFQSETIFNLIIWEKNNIVLHKIRLNPNDISELNQEFNATIGDVESTEKNLQKMSDYVTGLLNKKIKDSIQNKELLIIIPHGILHSLHWGLASLIDSEDKKYLGLEIPIVKSYSLELLYSCFKKEKGIKFEKLLFIKNPNFNLPALNLPGAEVEIHRIKTKLTNEMPDIDIKLLEKESAIKENYINEIKNNPEIVHFSGHAEYYPLNPWLSHLKFYGDKEESIFSVSEILLHRFESTPLMILSACNTGMERIRPGDEFFGLKRAFYLANVSSILATNWPLLDEIGPYFMDYFYSSILDGKTVALALFEAKNKLYEEGFTNLYDWAVFDLHGNPFKKKIE